MIKRKIFIRAPGVSTVFPKEKVCRNKKKAMVNHFDRNEQEILAAIVKFIADDNGAISK